MSLLSATPAWVRSYGGAMASDEGGAPRPDPAAVEAALAVVPGIVSAEAVTDADGVPESVRFLLEPGADETEVAAAAHRILRLQFGVGLDPRRIQVIEESRPERVLPAPRLHLVDEDSHDVVELGDELTPLLTRIDQEQGRYGTAALESATRHPAGLAAAADRPAGSQVDVLEAPAPPSRLAIAHLAVAADGLSVTARVTLERAGRSHVGVCEGSADVAAVRRSVAQATTNAVADALGSTSRLDVEVVSLVPAGSIEVVVVQVAWVGTEGSERLLGAAEVRGDVRQTVIRATLDAVNRRLSLAFDR